MTQDSPDDLYLLEALQELSGAAIGDSACFVLSRPDCEEDSYRSQLWLLEAGAEEPRPVSAAAFSAASPVLAPRGEALAFLSCREGTKRAYRLGLDGAGEAEALPATDGELQALLQWSGQDLLALERIEWTEQGQDPALKSEHAPQVVNFLPWKLDGRGPVVGTRTRLTALPLNGGAPRVLLQGDFEVSAAQRSPDAHRLACLRKYGERQRHRVELVLGRTDGSAMRAVESPLLNITGLRWSPDGRQLACVGSTLEGDSRMQLWLYAPDEDRWHCPWPELELEGDDLVWRGNGTSLAVIAAHRGLFRLALLDPAQGRLDYVDLGDCQLSALCAYGDRLLFAADSPLTGGRLQSVDWQGSDLQRHGDFNAWLRKRRRLGLERRSFDVPDGSGGMETVEAWLLRDPDAGRPFPLLVDFHGGPHSVALFDLAGRLYWRDLCARGWAVLLPNTVGSGSYGAEFARRLRGRWGELDLPQVEAILDQLQQEGLIDTRIACTGNSYGGYLSAWAICHSPRFRAAVVSAPVADIESHAGTSDSGYYVTPYAMGGELPQCGERCDQLSPTSHCHAVTAPTLLLQGEDDQRCPLGQSEQLFARLVRCSRAPVRMVVYPGGSHALLSRGRPSHRLDAFRRLVDWLQTWTQPAEPAAAASPGD